MSYWAVGNVVSFAVGGVFGWLPWQVAAVFAVLLSLLLLASTKLFAWGDDETGLLPVFGTYALPLLPGLVAGASIGMFLRQRGHRA